MFSCQPPPLPPRQVNTGKIPVDKMIVPLVNRTIFLHYTHLLIIPQFSLLSQLAYALKSFSTQQELMLCLLLCCIWCWYCDFCCGCRCYCSLAAVVKTVAVSVVMNAIFLAVFAIVIVVAAAVVVVVVALQ